MNRSRFDYVKYDEKASLDQSFFKAKFEDLECEIEATLKAPAYKTLAIRKLEECYMYIGKAIRDDQIARDCTTELQEGRSNS
jgi:hypothetical protein